MLSRQETRNNSYRRDIDATRRQTRTQRANYPHKLTKAAERWLGGGAAFGRLQLHGVMAAAHRSLRGKRQSRQPPFRCETGMVGGFAA